MRWGTLVEPIVAQYYSEETGYTVTKPDTMRSKKYPWVVGSPDGLIVEKPNLGLEIKTANEFSRGHWGVPGTDQVPENYICQCQHYMILTERTEWDLAVVIGNGDFRIYHLFADAEFHALLLEEEKEFYDRYVIGNDTPPLDFGRNVRNYIKRRWPRADPNKKITVTADMADLKKSLIDLRQARYEFIRAQQKRTTAEENVKVAIGDAEELIWQEQGIHISWKNNQDSIKTDWKEAFRALLPSSRLTADEKRQLVEKYSEEKTGARVFRVKDEFEDDDE